MQCTKGDEFCYQTAWLLTITQHQCSLRPLQSETDSRTHTSYQADRPQDSQHTLFCIIPALLRNAPGLCAVYSAEINISCRQFDQCLVRGFTFASNNEGAVLIGRVRPALVAVSSLVLPIPVVWSARLLPILS